MLYFLEYKVSYFSSSVVQNTYKYWPSSNNNDSGWLKHKKLCHQIVMIAKKLFCMQVYSVYSH